MARGKQPFLGPSTNPRRQPVERWAVPVLLSVLLLTLGSTTQAQTSVSLAWGASPDINVVGYEIYYGNVSGSSPSRLDVTTNLLGTVTGLTEGLTYYFVAVGYDQQGVESPPSNEVSFQPVAGRNQICGRVLW